MYEKTGNIVKLARDKNTAAIGFICQDYVMARSVVYAAEAVSIPAIVMLFPEHVTIQKTTGFREYAAMVKELADEGSCVIAGRSGFHILKDHPNRLHVFITASDSYRIRRVMEKQCLQEASAKALIASIDEARENYIKRHTGTSRYDARNYDLVLKADGHSEEELASLILAYIG